MRTGIEFLRSQKRTKMGTFQSSKLFDGYSTTFRQWKAEGTHCRFLHGYAISFRVWFAGELDHRNWVFDFGGMKRATNTIGGMMPKEWMAYMFDHTTIIADDDPALDLFKQMDASGLIQLRTLPDVGCEQFAKYLYDTLNIFLLAETKGRVSAVKVEVYEHDRNAASYSK